MSKMGDHFIEVNRELEENQVPPNKYTLEELMFKKWIDAVYPTDDLIHPPGLFDAWLAGYKKGLEDAY